MGDSGVACVEFVHRTDTSECDKRVPHELVTHSNYLAEFLFKQYGRRSLVAEHAIDTVRFVPQPQLGEYVGAVTSYCQTKGLDVPPGLGQGPARRSRPSVRGSRRD